MRLLRWRTRRNFQGGEHAFGDSNPSPIGAAVKFPDTVVPPVPASAGPGVPLTEPPSPDLPSRQLTLGLGFGGTQPNGKGEGEDGPMAANFEIFYNDKGQQVPVFRLEGQQAARSSRVVRLNESKAITKNGLVESVCRRMRRSGGSDMTTVR